MSELFIDRSDSRTRIVKELGYSSYQKYCESDLWKRIKAEVFAISPACCICNAPPFTVHHDFYSRPNLSGKSLKGLYPICKRCHDTVHFDENRKKVSPTQARKRLLFLMPKKKSLPF